MPRYFFHIRDGQETIPDLEGVELDNARAAHQEAIAAAREMLAAKVERGEIIDGQEFLIVDNWGNRIEVLPFKSTLRMT